MPTYHCQLSHCNCNCICIRTFSFIHGSVNAKMWVTNPVDGSDSNIWLGDWINTSTMNQLKSIMKRQIYFKKKSQISDLIWKKILIITTLVVKSTVWLLWAIKSNHIHIKPHLKQPGPMQGHSLPTTFNIPYSEHCIWGLSTAILSKCFLQGISKRWTPSCVK